MLNYRHPGPRRVWKGGSEQHLLTPFWLAPAAPVENSKWLQNIMKINGFGTFDPPKMRPTLKKPKENQCSGLRTLKNLRKINIFQSQAPGVPQETPGALQRPFLPPESPPTPNSATGKPLNAGFWFGKNLSYCFRSGGRGLGAEA